MDSVSHAPRSAPGGAIAAPLAALTDARPRTSPYALIAGGALSLAALSLAITAAPAYDPWAWIVWGRQILHLHLVTTGGPSWKPLPVIFTTVFAAFGGAAPDLWLVVARAGGLMAVALSALLASRLAPRRARWAAAVLAPAGLLLLSHYALSVAQGESEGLLVAVVLLAVLRHLDGFARQALWLGFAAALIRPETWPFLALYGLWLARRDPRSRASLAAFLVLIPALWFLPEVWGSGSAIRGIQWAQYPRAGSPAFARCPFCAELTGQAWPMAIGPVKIGVLLALLAAGPRARVLVAAAGAWILEEAVLTQIGFSGNDRYLICPVAVLIVVAATGWGIAMRGRVRMAVAATLAAASMLLLPGRGPGAFGHVLRFDNGLRNDMTGAVDAAGGSRRLLACGPVQTNPSEAPLLAWTVNASLRSTESDSGAVRIQAANGPGAKALPAVPAGYKLIAADGAVRIFSACGAG
jgi:hypothetical protein